MLWKLILALALAALPVAAQMNCSLQNLAGTYAVYNEGVLITTSEGASQPVAAPFAEIGMVYIDPSGSVTGWLTMANPQIYDFEIVDGVISVQPNCVGAMTAKLRVKGTQTLMPSPLSLPFVVKNRDPKEIHSVVLQGPMGAQMPIINLAVWTRVSPLNTPQANCSATQLIGTYIVDGKATIYVTNPDMSVTPVPASWTMLGTLDAQGKFTGGGPMDLPIAMPPTGMGDTSLEVNPDCTGTFKFKFKDLSTGVEFPGQGIEKLIIMRDGDRLTVKALYLQGILGKPVGLETWTRVSQQVQ